MSLIGALAIWAAQDVEAEARAWLPRLSGSLRFDERPEIGNALDPADDLGASRPEFAGILSLGLRFDRHRVAVRLETLRFRGSNRAEESFRWNETRYEPGEKIEADLRLLELSVDYGFRLVEVGNVVLELGASLRYLRFEPELSSELHESDDDTLSAFAPELAVRVAWNLSESIRLDLRAGGFAYRGSELSSVSISGELALAWVPLKWTAVSLGYRIEYLDLLSTAAGQSNEVRFRIDGPFLALDFRF